MIILGISAYYHDSAACLIQFQNGKVKILGAAQEERFTRKKFDSQFPSHSIRFCFEKSGLTISDVDSVVFYDKPWITFERLLETYISYCPKGLIPYLMAMPSWLSQKLNLKSTLKKAFKTEFKKIPKEILFSSHHLSHAASAFFASPYKEAAVLCMDGVGEWATTSLWHGQKNELSPISEIQFPHSIGLLYSAFTYFCGFKVNSGEYKLMGLAPYGEPVYTEKIKKYLIDIKPDGSFRLNMDYLAYTHSLKMISPMFEKLFGAPSRKANEPLRKLDLDLAASIQKVTEEVVLGLCAHIKNTTKSDYLCLAGGVALNCVANGKVLESGLFKEIWVQPAAGDSGGALGAALGALYLHHGVYRETYQDIMEGALLGPTYTSEQIEEAIEKFDLKPRISKNRPLALEKLIQDLSTEKVIGCFQGSMEYGPRALGHRSILGDPRSIKMQSIMNLKIKFREGFRPFAPAVIEEHCSEIFKLQQKSPYMLIVAEVQNKLQKAKSTNVGLEKVKDPHSVYPSITHVDYSARVQTVDKNTNPLFYEILERFYKETKCPLLINTSFNIRGEPIVNTPEEAIQCFLNTNMDSLFLDGYYICKEDNPNHQQDKNWRSRFELD